MNKPLKKSTEIIFDDNCIAEFDDTLGLRVGDVFYFSYKGTSPRSQADYKRLAKETGFKEFIAEGVIEAIDKKSKEFWVRLFEVEKVRGSLSYDHMVSISNPSIKWVESVTVKEVKDK